MVKGGGPDNLQTGMDGRRIGEFPPGGFTGEHPERLDLRGKETESPQTTDAITDAAIPRQKALEIRVNDRPHQSPRPETINCRT